MVQFSHNFSHYKKKKLLMFVSVFIALTALILGTIYVSINMETILQPFLASKSFCVKNDSSVAVIPAVTTEQPPLTSTEITSTSTTSPPSSPPPPPPVPTSTSASTESASTSTSTSEGSSTSSSASTATKTFEDNVDNKTFESTTMAASTSEAGFSMWGELDKDLDSKEKFSLNSSDEKLASQLMHSFTKTENETSASRTPDFLGPGEAASRGFQLVESLHKKHNVIGETINKWVKEILQKVQDQGNKTQKKDANENLKNLDLTSTPTSSI